MTTDAQMLNRIKDLQRAAFMLGFKTALCNISEGSIKLGLCDVPIEGILASANDAAMVAEREYPYVVEEKVEA